jgi:hypothetical protein
MEVIAELWKRASLFVDKFEKQALETSFNEANRRAIIHHLASFSNHCFPLASVTVRGAHEATKAVH